MTELSWWDLTVLMFTDVVRWGHELQKYEVIRQIKDLDEQHRTILQKMRAEQKVVEPLNDRLRDRTKALRKEVKRHRQKYANNDNELKTWLRTKHLQELYDLQLLRVTIREKMKNINIYTLIMNEVYQKRAVRTAYLENMNLAETLDDMHRAALTMQAYDLSASSNLITKEIEKFILSSRRPEQLAGTNERIAMTKETLLHMKNEENEVDDILNHLLVTLDAEEEEVVEDSIPLESPCPSTS
jgi:hypothetical protein